MAIIRFDAAFDQRLLFPSYFVTGTLEYDADRVVYTMMDGGVMTHGGSFDSLPQGGPDGTIMSIEYMFGGIRQFVFDGLSIPFEPFRIYASNDSYQVFEAIFAGADRVYGSTASDFVQTGNGGDTITGGTGHDTLFGMYGDNLVYGNTGDDYIGGDIDSDTIYGGQGADLVHGGGGGDVIYGNLGNDTLTGENRGDPSYVSDSPAVYYGGQGDDILAAAAGADTLFGNTGNDTLAGGGGADRYVFGGGMGDDVIYGYESQLDQIELRGGLALVSSAVVGGDTVVTLTGGTITLVGVQTQSIALDIIGAAG